MSTKSGTNEPVESSRPIQHAVSRTSTHRSKTVWLDDIGVFPLLLSFRLLNAFVIHTFFQPDEYYQALEPAWQLVFGNGSAAWITWEWRQHLRSAIHPALFALVYKVADLAANLLSLSSPARADLFLGAPKILQATIAATGEYYTWTMAQRIYGKGSTAAWTTLLLSICSPWQWFCSTRTFSNCLETTLTIMALNEWPWEWTASAGQEQQGKSQTTGRLEVAGLRKALLYAAIATVLRPTNILIWISISVYTLVKAFIAGEGGNTVQTAAETDRGRQQGHSVWSKSFLLLREAILCGSTVLAMSAMVDRIFYGTWTFPPYNFLYFNVLQSLAVFYGNNNWHYYLSEGYPLLLTTSLPFTVPSLIRVFNGYHSFKALPSDSQVMLRGLAIVCITLPAALSILSHKEVRFIYPILPCLQIVTALQASELSLAFTTRAISADHIRARRRSKRVMIGGLLSLGVFIAGYVTRVHNSGLLSLPEYFRHEFEIRYLSPALQHDSHSFQQNVQARNMTVAFLMPCHSVPWRSHLQYPPTESQIGIQAWALTCEPPLHLADPVAKQAYMDEADVFYDNPKAWIRSNMARDLPTRTDAAKRKGDSKTGIKVADEAMDYRNKKLWDSSQSKDRKQYKGLDITDLLPGLITSPVSVSANPKFNNDVDSPSKASPTGITRRPWPDYIAFFAQLEPTLKSTLYSYGPDAGGVYTECYRSFNSHWHDDSRRKGDVIVWCLNPPLPLSEDIDIEGPRDIKSQLKVDGIKSTEVKGREEMGKDGKKATGDRGNKGGKQTVVGGR